MAKRIEVIAKTGLAGQYTCHAGQHVHLPARVAHQWVRSGVAEYADDDVSAPKRHPEAGGRETHVSADVGERETREAPEWTLKTSPEDYLEKYPDGPNADLARQILDNQ